MTNALRGPVVVLGCVLLGHASLAQSLDQLPSDTPLATVGGTSITAGDVLRETVHRYAFMAVQDMLFERFLEQRCQEAGVSITADDLQPGQNLHMARFERLFEEQAEASPTEVRAIYDSQPERYRLDTVRAQGILLESQEDAQALLDSGLSEANFEQWARDVSMHESAADGGKLGDVTVLSMPDHPEAVQALFSAPGGALIGPIPSGDGWWLLLRGDPQPGFIAAFEDVREDIADEMRALELVRLWGMRHSLLRRGITRIVLDSMWDVVGGPPPTVLPDGVAGSESGE